jgi:hypothetical protein
MILRRDESGTSDEKDKAMGYPQLTLKSEGRREAAMRLEATVPESRGTALDQLAAEFGLSRSQVIDEALALFLKAVLEVRRGRRLVTVDPKSPEAACEIATPTLTAIEWTARPQAVQMSAAALERVGDLVSSAPKPNARLKAAAARFKEASKRRARR